MRRYFSSLARLYQSVAQLAARVFAQAPSEQAPDEPVQRPLAPRPPTLNEPAPRRTVSPPTPARLSNTATASPGLPPPSVTSSSRSPAKPIPASDDVASAVARLIDELRATDGVMRPAIAKRIQGYGSVAVPTLIPLVSDSEWVMRYWAAHLLKDMADPSAMPALQRQLPLEKDRVVKEEITKALTALRLFKVTAPQDLARLPVGMQGRLDELRRELIRAYHGQNAAEADRLRGQMVKLQVELVERLRGTPLGQDERRRLVTYYQNGSARKRLLSRSGSAYHNTCWVCRANVDSTANTACSCRWLICVCGACQCPDFSTGQRGHQPECQRQIARLGLARYHELIEERQKLYGGWSRFGFARVDFSG